MKTYTICPKAIGERTAALLKKHLPLHHKLHVTIDHLFVTHDGDGPALKLGGYACLAIIRKTSVKERAAGRADCEMVIDQERYLGLTERQQTALLHHELHHIELKLDGKGRPKADAAGRPVVKMRLHDQQFGWFDDIARLYGEDSIEIMQARALLSQRGQLYFDLTIPVAAEATA